MTSTNSNQSKEAHSSNTTRQSHEERDPLFEHVGMLMRLGADGLAEDLVHTALRRSDRDLAKDRAWQNKMSCMTRDEFEELWEIVGRDPVSISMVDMALFSGRNIAQIKKAIEGVKGEKERSAKIKELIVNPKA